MRRTLHFCLLLLGLTCCLQASVIHIPGEYSTIQAGINAAAAGDMVLVQPGRYVECIDFKGKNIVVGSMMYITCDTSYIRQTIIDGNSSGNVVTFRRGEDTTAVLNGFTITGGSPGEGPGGGVSCENASPKLEYLAITNSSSVVGGGIGFRYSQAVAHHIVIQNCGYQINPGQKVRGGGLSCQASDVTIRNIAIYNNDISADPESEGGGIYVNGSHGAIFQDFEVDGNRSVNGAGIYCNASDATFINGLVQDNLGQNLENTWWDWGHGGGIAVNGYTPTFTNVRVQGNLSYWGGGVSASGSPKFLSCSIQGNKSLSGGGGFYFYGGGNPRIDACRVSRNESASWGGGVQLEEVALDLSTTTISRNRASKYSGIVVWQPGSIITHEDAPPSVYLNSSREEALGQDIKAFDDGDWSGDDINPITIHVDTFTVSDYTNRQVSPIETITLEINHGLADPKYHDLYVHPNGSDSNSGETSVEPLRTITLAMLQVAADSSNPRTIHLAEGTYSLSTNGETFPIYPKSNTHLKGIEQDRVILDAEYNSPLIIIRSDVTRATLENLTLTHGAAGNRSSGILSIGLAEWENPDNRPHPQLNLKNIHFQDNVGFYRDDRTNWAANLYAYNTHILMNNVQFGACVGIPFHTEGTGSLFLANSIISLESMDDLPWEISRGLRYNIRLSHNAIISNCVFYDRQHNNDIFIIPVAANVAVLNSALLDLDFTPPLEQYIDIDYSFVSGNVKGIGNQTGDPLFTDPENLDFTLDPLSLAIDAGDPSPLYHESNDTRNDIGLYGGSGLVAFPRVDFGLKPVADTSIFEWGIANFRPDSVVVDSLILENTYDFSIDWPGPITIPSFSFYSFDIRFHPMEIGDYEANLMLYSDDLYGANSAVIPVLASADTTVEIRQNSILVTPEQFALHPAYPNPFNPVTTIRYELPEAAMVRLVVYDLQGREITRLADNYLPAGSYESVWDGRDGDGRVVPSGIYIARLVTAEYSKAIKMVLLK
ncbi:FlgD immunoglobulin-like domain containing protein [Candidatus Neomarinimicrobiota bacterium]